jgi:hypothetical protein
MARLWRGHRTIARLLILTFLLELFAPLAPTSIASAATTPTSSSTISGRAATEALLVPPPAVQEADFTSSRQVSATSTAAPYPAPQGTQQSSITSAYPAPATATPATVTATASTPTSRPPLSATFTSLNIPSTNTYWEYYPSGAIGSADLAQIGRYNQVGGPCHGWGAGQCYFDSLAYVPMSNGTIMESITRGNFYWNYIGDSIVGSGTLTSVGRYMTVGINEDSGPCRFFSPETNCRFDSRTIFIDRQGRYFESITVQGRFLTTVQTQVVTGCF